MKYILLIGVFIFSMTAVFAQNEGYYWSVASIIYDKEGYTNLLESMDLNSPVKDSLENGKVLWASVTSEPEYGLAEIWYNKKYQTEPEGYLRSCDDEMMEIGYLSAQHIHSFNQLRQLEWWEYLDEGGVSISSDSLGVFFYTSAFEEKKHQITRDSEGWVSKIDGRDAWGVDGTLPSAELSSIIIWRKVGEGIEEYTLPASALKNIYEPVLTTGYTGVFLGQQGELFIIMNNGDGAGAYTVCWTFINGKLAKMDTILLF